MAASFDDMVEYAREKLTAMNAHFDGSPTAGPIAQCLIMSMRISWGVHRVIYEDESTVLFGKNTAVPIDAIPALIELSQLHLEPFHVLRAICADLIEGGEKLPPDVRTLCAGFVRGVFAEPRKKTLKQRETPSHEQWLRKHAIVLVLHGLSEKYKLKPTSNRARSSSSPSGAQVVAEALRLIWDKASNQISLCPSERSVEAIWENRKDVTNVFQNAKAELQALRSEARAK